MPVSQSPFQTAPDWYWDYGLDYQPATTGQGVSAAFGISGQTGPVNLLRDLMAVARARGHGSDSVFLPGGIPGLEPEAEEPVRLSPEQANEKYGDLGLSFNRPVTEEEAEVYARRRRREIAREHVLARAPKDLGSQVAYFGAGLAAQALDPINVVVSLIPSVGTARFAAWAGRSGVAGAAVRGGVEGIVGAAAIEPLVYAGARALQDDYTLADSLANVAFGGIIGGAFGAGSKAIWNLVAPYHPQTRDAALRTAIAKYALDEPVNVSAVLRADPAAHEGGYYSMRAAIEAGDIVESLRRQIAEADQRVREAGQAGAAPGAYAEAVGRLETIDGELRAPDLPADRRADLQREREAVVASIAGGEEVFAAPQRQRLEALEAERDTLRSRLAERIKVAEQERAAFNAGIAAAAAVGDTATFGARDLSGVSGRLGDVQRVGDGAAFEIPAALLSGYAGRVAHAEAAANRAVRGVYDSQRGAAAPVTGAEEILIRSGRAYVDRHGRETDGVVAAEQARQEADAFISAAVAEGLLDEADVTALRAADERDRTPQYLKAISAGVRCLVVRAV
ncbi:MAG: hypothetical protein HXY25_06930 [Alphaproteobacteria bacterium]|nr:hypothetical protein [Alphaproteobacteria bacterium]